MPSKRTIPVKLQTLNLPLQRDPLMRQLVRSMVESLSTVFGTEEAEGLLGIVAQQLATDIQQHYKTALSLADLPADHLSAVLVDLQRRLKSDFFVIEESPQRIVLGNRVCPFADKHRPSPAMCTMTSSLFGTIAADAVGYAKVGIERAIAGGDQECRVVIHLQRTDESDVAPGRDYYRGVNP